MTCPNCSATLGVTVLSKHALPSGDGFDAVENFALRLRGRFTAADLKRMYDERAREAGWPQMSAKMFGRCLRAAGAEPWRTDSARGWSLPDRRMVTTPDPMTPQSR